LTALDGFVQFALEAKPESNVILAIPPSQERFPKCARDIRILLRMIQQHMQVQEIYRYKPTAALWTLLFRHLADRHGSNLEFHATVFHFSTDQRMLLISDSRCSRHGNVGEVVHCLSLTRETSGAQHLGQMPMMAFTEYAFWLSWSGTRFGLGWQLAASFCDGVVPRGCVP